VRQHLTRRRVLLGSGALAAGTTGSIALTTQGVSASVSGEFTVPDASTALVDKQLQDIRLKAVAAWQYDANATMDGVELELHVGQAPDTLDLIARSERTDDIATDSLSGETTLTGSLMSASDFDIDAFTPTNGSVSRSVIAELRFYVLRDGSVEAEAKARTTFGVTVRDEELTVETTLGGTGEVKFKTG